MNKLLAAMMSAVFAMAAGSALAADDMKKDGMKKDMMAKTNGPPMRVGVIKISREEDQLDEEIKNPLALAAT